MCKRERQSEREWSGGGLICEKSDLKKKKNQFYVVKKILTISSRLLGSFISPSR